MKPNRGGILRPHAEAPRQHFLVTDVTDEEYHGIQQYCLKRKISISQFLADLMLKDARRPAPKPDRKVRVGIVLELTPEEGDRLELLVRLRQKKSAGTLVHELLRPLLKLQRVHAPLNTRMLRYYLSATEHRVVMKHLERKGISARNYAALLARRAITKNTRLRRAWGRRRG